MQFGGGIQFVKNKFEKEYGKTDKILFVIIVMLIAVGLIALFSASLVESRDNLGNFLGYFIKQLIQGFFVGIVLAFIFYKIPLRRLKGITLPFFLFSWILTCLVFIPGLSVEGGITANRWLDFGLFVLQPSELLKLSSILYLSALLETKQKHIRESYIIVVFLFLLGMVALPLIFQPDFSTLALIGIIFFIIYFVAGAPSKNLIILILVGTIVGGALLVVQDYRIDRITGFLNPREDTTETAFHINQAQTSIGSGKLYGSGFLDGLQHRRRLPEPMNDSIFAVWADETGFIGSSLVVILFLLLNWRIVWIGQRSKDIFSRLTLIGISSWIFLQAFINIGAMVNVVPLTGMALPYISYGSSSLVTILIASGIVLQLSNKK